MTKIIDIDRFCNLLQYLDLASVYVTDLMNNFNIRLHFISLSFVLSDTI